MLQEILKQATSQQHDDLEKLMYVDKIMNGTLSAEEYKSILSTNYIVHACFEDKIYEGFSEDLKQKLQIDQRNKLKALELDLQEIGLNKPEIDCPQNAEFKNNNARLLGAMYVFEGATLGGNVIVKKLKKNPNLQSLNLGFHYYQVYGENLIQYWKQFCHVLNTEVSENHFDESIQSALNMFANFKLAQNDELTQTSVLQN